jgi:glycyl-tRNA synthetase alpha subunit
MAYLQLIIDTSLSNIYLFSKSRFSSFKFNFSEFQQLRNRYANYTLDCVFVIQWSLILNNFDKFINKIF